MATLGNQMKYYFLRFIAFIYRLRRTFCWDILAKKKLFSPLARTCFLRLYAVFTIVYYTLAVKIRGHFFFFFSIIQIISSAPCHLQFLSSPVPSKIFSSSSPSLSKVIYFSSPITKDFYVITLLSYLSLSLIQILRTPPTITSNLGPLQKFLFNFILTVESCLFLFITVLL